MELSDYKELLHSAREQFIKGNYAYAEPVLQQILLRNGALPEVYQMLATIYYDQGKFNKAIKTFQKALEVDPTYTDASVGLSIILNDLGRYDEAKNIFETAQSKLNQRKGGHDPLLDPKLAAKHADLASLYFRYQRYQEALEQYQKAYALSKNQPEMGLHLVECLIKLGGTDKAVQELKNILQAYPTFSAARSKLGVVYYNSNRVAEAAEQWESVLNNDPQNDEVRGYLRIAQNTGITQL